jgi:hypothetical protein
MKLGSGTHLPDTENPCVMEYVSRLQGEEFSDHPVCVHPVIASAARAVNDWMPDGDRDKLLLLVSSMVGTSGIVTDDEAVSSKISLYINDSGNVNGELADRLYRYMAFVIDLVRSYA